MSTAYADIALDVADGVATITLDRPERLNAFDESMMHQVIDAIDRVDADDDVRAVIFTGRGRAFCAGADLSVGETTFERAGNGGFAMERDADGGGILARRLFAARKPLIAAINGPAVGIGITMTLPMDIRLAAEGARIGFVFARRGLVPEACSSWFLPRLVGISQAAEWVFTGRIFDAAEAQRAGLVRSVHAADELMPAARALATEIAANTAPVAVSLARHMLWQMLCERGPEEAHEIDSRGIFELGRSADVREGVAAFLEKRAPAFPVQASSGMPRFYDEWRERGSVAALLTASDRGEG